MKVLPQPFRSRGPKLLEHAGKIVVPSFDHIARGDHGLKMPRSIRALAPAELVRRLRLGDLVVHGDHIVPAAEGASRQFWEETLAWATADGAAVNTTATETIVFPNVTIPGGFMQDGRNLKLTAYGRWSNVVTAVPTITWAVRWGGVAGVLLAQSPAIVTPAAATTNAPWRLEVTLQTRTNGATGTIFAMGEVLMGTGVAPTFGTVANYGVVAPMSSTGTTAPAVSAAVDLTADTALSITGKFSASNAANGFTGHLYVIEALN